MLFSKVESTHTRRILCRVSGLVFLCFNDQKYDSILVMIFFVKMKASFFASISFDVANYERGFGIFFRLTLPDYENLASTEFE